MFVHLTANVVDRRHLDPDLADAAACVERYGGEESDYVEANRFPGDVYDSATGSWAAFINPGLVEDLRGRVTEEQRRRADQQVLQFDKDTSTWTLDIDAEVKIRMASLFGISLFGLLPPSGSYAANEGSVMLTAGELLVLAGAIVTYQATIAGVSSAKRAEIASLPSASLPGYDISSGWPSTLTIVDISGAVEPSATSALVRLAALETWRGEASQTLVDHDARLAALEQA